MLKRIGCGLALLVLCGCFKNKDELSINADGSGRVRIEVRAGIPPELVESMGHNLPGGTGVPSYPPMSEAQARQLFPARDFNLTVKHEKADDNDTLLVVEAEFKDLNALLASPYARVHQLSLKIEKDVLVLKAITGAEAAARFAEIKDEGMGMLPFAAGTDRQKKNEAMRAEFRVTLPAAITSANGTKEGGSATWIIERAKCKDAEDFARQLGAVAEARCPAASLRFKPVTPIRLGLLPFAELTAAAGTGTGVAIDTNQVAAAGKFVPYGLVVTRSVDLSGEGGSHESGAQLVGAIVLPEQHKPQRWGETVLDEAVDAQGNDLKPGEGNEGRLMAMRYRHYGGRSEGDETDETNSASSLRRVVTLAFRAPEWKVAEIARVKGSVSLRYFGDSQLVKLTNAIPAKWIMEQNAMRMGMFNDRGEKRLDNGQLGGLGLDLTFQMGMVQAGTTMLVLGVEGKEAALVDAQVFDAEGRPWPTILSSSEDDPSASCQIVVPGKPQPPLSLAFLASSSGSSVEVPILVEHVPVSTR